MDTPPIRIVLVDDHQVLLDSLAALINMSPEFNVVGKACTAEQGLQATLQAKPDVVILDIELPGCGAFEIAACINNNLPNTKIIFLTAYLSDVFLEQALRLQASGYLLKGEPVERLTEAISRAFAGQVTFSQEVKERLEFDPQQQQPYAIKSNTRLLGLTSRQLSILRHLARGQSVKEVARELELSEKSVDSHKYRIMHALGIHDRVELARFAIREGLTLP